MTQKTGALIFDETADRYDIRFDLNDYYGGGMNNVYTCKRTIQYHGI